MRNFQTRTQWPVLLGLVIWLSVVATAQAQSYIGFVYPAGGQQGTTFRITLGGQSLEGVSNVFISGSGVQARVVEYNKKMGNQEITLLNEQLKELKNSPPQTPDEKITNLVARLEKILSEHVDQPASASIANLVIVEATIAPDAKPGEREIRLVTPRWVSNPLVFNIGQLPEVSTAPVPTSQRQVLGREEKSLRRKKQAAPAPGGSEMMMAAMMTDSPGSPSGLDDDEVRIKVPCTVNGQITSGAVDRFRFKARTGQRLVIIVQARGLIPYMADGVPGWFQAVLALYNAQGREVAYNDDCQFRPDPVILYEVPEDGEYLLAIHDALYRGREDFVYRISIGELPYVTSLFPLGGQAGTSPTVELDGWNLLETMLTPDTKDAAPGGVYPINTRGQGGLISNPMPFAIDGLPECLENKPHNTPAAAQKLTRPVIVNGRIDSPGDRDVFRFEGQAGDEVVAEVYARRLDSPLDSTLKLTDAAGKCLAFNDDREDAGSGLNTHHADSYIRAVLPTNGVYYIHLEDAQHHGGEEYAYRLRVSAPQPDFALRVVPSGVSLRGKSGASVSVYAIRRDGFTGNIKLELKNAPKGFEIKGGNLKGTQELTQITLKTSLAETKEPVSLIVEGRATNGERKIVHEAVPAEDRMQAFLWRHLVPAKELKAFVFNPPPPPPKPEPPKQPVPPTPPKPPKPEPTNPPASSATSKPEPPKPPVAPATSKP